jgi:hypothetical protein
MQEGFKNGFNNILEKKGLVKKEVLYANPENFLMNALYNFQ